MTLRSASAADRSTSPRTGAPAPQREGTVAGASAAATETATPVHTATALVEWAAEFLDAGRSFLARHLWCRAPAPADARRGEGPK